MTSAYDRFVQADREWQAEIERAFPKEHPGDVRYTERAHGEPGSVLRVKYEAFHAAREAWEKERGETITHRHTGLDEQYRSDGWGLITDAALGIPPHRVESQARDVARYAHERIAVLEQACGAAAVAMLMDMDGSQIAASEHDSPFMLACRAVGLDPLNGIEKAIEIVGRIRAQGPLSMPAPKGGA